MIFNLKRMDFKRIWAKGGFLFNKRRASASRRSAYARVCLFVRFPYFCGAA